VHIFTFSQRFGVCTDRVGTYERKCHQHHGNNPHYTKKALQRLRPKHIEHRLNANNIVTKITEHNSVQPKTVLAFLHIEVQEEKGSFFSVPFLTRCNPLRVFIFFPLLNCNNLTLTEFVPYREKISFRPYSSSWHIHTNKHLPINQSINQSSNRVKGTTDEKIMQNNSDCECSRHSSPQIPEEITQYVQ